ncbi:tyrosine-type recombinase/integrase [Pseudocitrobacter faecalis]|uniref:tyrosine-type recombinase/integrase n=1 Tax=Pseudocitrobacter faecalis TaxID=1398493 RepID=UPI003B9E7B2F
MRIRIHRRREKLSDIDRADFEQALIASDISDFRFHDLRHTWASWHVLNGTPLMTLNELGGWETLKMVEKYAHLSAEHLNRFVGSVTFLAQENELETMRNKKIAASN